VGGVRLPQARGVEDRWDGGWMEDAEDDEEEEEEGAGVRCSTWDGPASEQLSFDAKLPLDGAHTPVLEAWGGARARWEAGRHAVVLKTSCFDERAPATVAELLAPSLAAWGSPEGGGRGAETKTSDGWEVQAASFEDGGGAEVRRPAGAEFADADAHSNKDGADAEVHGARDGSASPPLPRPPPAPEGWWGEGEAATEERAAITLVPPEASAGGGAQGSEGSENFDVSKVSEVSEARGAEVAGGGPSGEEAAEDWKASKVSEVAGEGGSAGVGAASTPASAGRGRGGRRGGRRGAGGETGGTVSSRIALFQAQVRAYFSCMY